MGLDNKDDKVESPKQEEKPVKPKFSLSFDEVISQLSEEALPYISESEIAYALHRKSISPYFLNHFVSDWPAREGRQWLCKALSEINKFDTPVPFSMEFVQRILPLLIAFPAVREKVQQLLLTTNTFNPANWSLRSEVIHFDEDIIKELLASFIDPALCEVCLNNPVILANIQKMDLTFLIAFIALDCELQKKIIILESKWVIKLKPQRADTFKLDNLETRNNYALIHHQLIHLQIVEKLITIPNEKLVICLQHQAFCDYVLTMPIKDIEIVQKFLSSVIFSPATQAQNIHALLDDLVKFPCVVAFLEDYGYSEPYSVHQARSERARTHRIPDYQADYKLSIEKNQIGIDPNKANFKSIDQFLPQALQSSYVRYSIYNPATQDHKCFTASVARDFNYFISGFLLSDVFLGNVLSSNLPDVMSSITKPVFLLVVDYCRWVSWSTPAASEAVVSATSASAVSVFPEAATAAVTTPTPLRFNHAYAFFHFLNADQKIYFDPEAILIRALRIIGRNFKEDELRDFMALISLFIKYSYPDINKVFHRHMESTEIEQMMNVAGEIVTAIKKRKVNGGFWNSPGEYAKVINEILSSYPSLWSRHIDAYEEESTNKLINFLRSIGKELNNLRHFVYSDEFSNVCKNIQAVRLQLGIQDKEDVRIVLARLLDIAIVDVVDGPRAYFIDPFPVVDIKSLLT